MTKTLMDYVKQADQLLYSWSESEFIDNLVTAEKAARYGCSTLLITEHMTYFYHKEGDIQVLPFGGHVDWKEEK